MNGMCSDELSRKNWGWMGRDGIVVGGGGGG
jgi:hypothetical protein